MSNEKSYLKNQIYLITLNSTDLFTDSELRLCSEIVNIKSRLENEMNDDLLNEKRALQKELNDLISSHENVPRKVNYKSVLSYKALNANKTAVSWNDLKQSRRIAEFCSEESRIFGLSNKSITYDKIIIKWEYLSILQQIIKDGFYMDVLQPDNTVKTIKYIIHTASAGQLRTSKLQALNEEVYNKYKDTLECGLSDEIINSKGGINVNKLLAYKALQSSATERWNIDIDRCIVVPDFEAPVSGIMQYIKQDYTSEIGDRTVSINHCDGCGMVLPSVLKKNAIVRGPWIKGLLSPFDFISFCIENHVNPIAKDRYGTEHNLITENIQIIFTDSQFKMAKYYSSWDEYKINFKKFGCYLSLTNYEDDYISDTEVNYQMVALCSNAY